MAYETGDLTSGILTLLDIEKLGLTARQLLSHLIKDIDPSVQYPEKSIGAALGHLSRKGLVTQSIDGRWTLSGKKESATPAVPVNLKSYIAEREGVGVAIHSDPRYFANVIAIEFSLDGTNFYPVHFDNDAVIHVGKQIPEWHESMDIYRNIASYRVFYKDGKTIKEHRENVQNMGWSLVIVESQDV